MATSVQDLQIKTENICRTCLSKELEVRSVYDLSYESVSFNCLIAEITGVQINVNDGLPSTICNICKEKAINAYKFRKQSQESNATLQIVYKKENIHLAEIEITETSEDDGIKVEEPSADDNNYDDWIALDEFNDIDAVKDENEESQSNFQCKACGLIFDTHNKLQHHTMTKCLKVELEEPGNNYCPLCGTSYYDSGDLSKHMWESHPEVMGREKRGRPNKILTTAILNKLSENGFRFKALSFEKFSCTICKEQCKTKENLSKHLQIHKDIKVFCCIICNKMYLKKNNFGIHVCVEGGKTKESTSIEDDTGKSKYKFLSEIIFAELLRHREIQTCELCSGLFLSEGDLIAHFDAEHPERSRRCNVCLKVFATLKSAAKHRNICKEIERKHKCSTCGLKFAYEISLNKHILRYHEGQSVSVKFMDTKSKDDDDEDGKQYQCDTCNKQFSRKELLAKHTRTHSGKHYECDICKKKFNRSDNLRSHKRTHDPREKTKANTCLCLYCGRSFNNSSNLIVHMRRHTGEKPYKCDFCGKGFPRSSDLQCHRRSHTGEKPCICRVCGKGFSRSNKLSRHMRVHTGQKPYKCKYCEKAFSQSNDLTLHVRRHTGDKPYICEMCGERFIQGTALQNHRRTHGHFPPAEPPTQGMTFTVISQQNTSQQNT
ncbi:hypothetical protein ACJJTC_001011 [Scirpophaga incertulas]